MKNNEKKGMLFIDINRNILKILMVMKLTTFFFLISIMSVAARGYSQHARLNLSLQNASIQELFEEIEKQSEFNFFYKDVNVVPFLQVILHPPFKLCICPWQIIAVV